MPHCATGSQRVAKGWSPTGTLGLCGVGCREQRRHWTRNPGSLRHSLGVTMLPRAWASPACQSCSQARAAQSSLPTHYPGPRHCLHNPGPVHINLSRNKLSGQEEEGSCFLPNGEPSEHSQAGRDPWLRLPPTLEGHSSPRPAWPHPKKPILLPHPALPPPSHPGLWTPGAAAPTLLYPRTVRLGTLRPGQECEVTTRRSGWQKWEGIPQVWGQWPGHTFFSTHWGSHQTKHRMGQRLPAWARHQALAAWQAGGQLRGQAHGAMAHCPQHCQQSLRWGQAA